MFKLFSGLFAKKKVDIPELVSHIRADMHSHLLPGIDDGSKSLEESLTLIRGLIAKGYSKLITTPHIMIEQYRNTPEIIQTKLIELQKFLQENGVKITIEAAAEYMLDEGFPNKIKEGNLLTFGDRYVLIETSFLVKPQNLTKIFFELKTLRYKPILAHPERYAYLWNSFSAYDELKDAGFLFQLNLNSLSGVYSERAEKASRYLIKNGMINFVGTDTHSEKHIERLNDAFQDSSIQQLIQSGELLNATL
ncbi:MAG: hypothetical protein NZ108_04305 [Bacteroidia bacterium]|nr:hypothetical protein [Bacteroidia bacterium]